jgi:hypothetical protein
MKSIFFTVAVMTFIPAIEATSAGLGESGALDQGKITYKTWHDQSAIQVEFTFKEPIESAESTILATIFMTKTCHNVAYVLDSGLFASGSSEIRRGKLKFHCAKSEKKIAAGASQKEFVIILCGESEAQKPYLVELCKEI